MANGLVRQEWYAKQTGELAAHQISTATLLVAVAVYLWAIDRARPLPSARAAVRVGVALAVATMSFEVVLGMFLRPDPLTFAEVLNGYDLSSGRVWVAVPLFLTAGPTLVRRLRLRRDQSVMGGQTARDGWPTTAAAFVRRHRFGSYVVGAFAVSWTGVLIVAWSAGFAFHTTQAVIPVLLAMLPGPPVSAVAVTAVADGRPGLRDLWQRLCRWRVGARWYAFLLVMPVVVVGVLATLGRVVDEAYAPGFNPAFILIGLAAGSCEELGWTGVATPELLRRHRPLSAALMLGVVWSGWHVLADAITNEGGYWLPSLWLPKFATVFIVGLIAWRVVMTYVYARTESVLLGVLLHGLYTGSLGAFQVPGSDGDYVTWTAVMAGVVCVIAALVVRAHRSGREVE